MRVKGNNVFVNFLALLGTRHAELFANQTFNEHHHKNNLYGLSRMLSDYGVQNAATKIEDREQDIFNIECPFVAFFGGDFVVVEKVSPHITLTKGEAISHPSGESEGAVSFIRNGKRLIIPVSDFIKSWSGIVLLAETSSASGEPGYAAHHKKELLSIAQKIVLGLACLSLVLYAYFKFNLYTNLGFSLLLLINLLGIYTCYLLVLKQLHVQSRYVDKICTLFSRSDCNNVLESDAAKLFGVFGWSEIGLGYFTANTVILLFLPQLLPWLVVFNILALPYSFWSVWYQKVKARQWCPLCLMVQILLWAIFVINLLFSFINFPDLLFHCQLSIVNCQLFTVACCVYAIPILTLCLIIPKLAEGSQVVQLRQEISSIKANEDIFRALLLQQTQYEATASDSQIIFGNPTATLKITILTNPFCNPCARMHARVDKLLKETKGTVCIRYIFSAFNENLEYANRSFIAIYLQKGRETAWQLYSDWFDKGKALEAAFFNDMQLDMTNPAIESEFAKHEAWKEKTQLRATPTIVVNGFKLPDNYKIEDLQYFTESEIEV
ncbi:MAG: thioredoxin domain-containing protein [Tannerella sp.]|jgi:hypothetical protein|nr:thioredoxin domain-containing protein [Tannerella sp.]